MGIIGRLAWRNLRHRPGQAALLLLALCLSTTSLSLALAVNETGNGAWDRVWRATGSSDVYGTVVYRSQGPMSAVDAASIAQARDRLAALATAPGVAAVGGPWPTMYTSGELGGLRVDLLALVHEPAPAAVGQPLVAAGEWLDGGDGVVLEDGLATALHIRPGDMITVAGLPLPVRGVAMTVSHGRYPMYQPGQIWVNPATAQRLTAAGAHEVSLSIELRLAEPDDATAFAAAHSDPPGSGAQGQFGVNTWQEVRQGSHDDLTAFAVALLVIGSLLAALTIATAAVLVAGRMAAQIRQVGTLKAVGVTPGQITWVLLVEYLALAGVAAAIGIAAGPLLAPLLARSSATLYGAPQAPPMTWSRAAVVAAIAVAVVLLATVRPALRGARRSTMHSLTVAARPPRRPSRLAALAARLGLPLTVVLGLRSAARRPGRTLASAVGLALGVAMVVVGLALRRSFDAFAASQPDTDPDPAGRDTNQALIDQLLTLVYAAAGLLLLLATVNAIVVAAFAARDGARNHAIQRAVGATPRQTGTAFVVAQLGAGLLGAVLGIPLGVLLFTAFAGDDLNPIRLSLLTYALITVAAPIGYGLIATAQAWLRTRRPISRLLTYD